LIELGEEKSGSESFTAEAVWGNAFGGGNGFGREVIVSELW
jgi:hypothetical protein